MNRRSENSIDLEQAQKTEIVQALESIHPRTPMGQRLIELSLRGLKTGVEPLSADEVLEYLGHEPYEDVR
jgi:hypothetical protein